MTQIHADEIYGLHECFPLKFISWLIISGYVILSSHMNLCIAMNDRDMYVKPLIEAHQIPKLKCFLSRLAVVFAQSIEDRCYVDNEYGVGTAPTGDAPASSEWSTMLLPTKVRLILGALWYLKQIASMSFDKDMLTCFQFGH